MRLQGNKVAMLFRRLKNHRKAQKHTFPDIEENLSCTLFFAKVQKKVVQSINLTSFFAKKF